MKITNIKSDFTQVPNSWFRTRGLSLKATGLLCFMQSVGEEWEFTIAGLCALFSDGERSVRGAIEELRQAGLISYEQTKDAAGHFQKNRIKLYKTPQANRNDEMPSRQNAVTAKKQTINKNNNKEKLKINKGYKDIKGYKENNLMSAPAKPAPTRQLPKEAEQLAERLHKWILRNKPDRKISDGWQKRWAEDIDKMHRIDGRSWRQIAGAIDWSQRDNFWHQNILSGANLRKHYDRIEDRARAEMEDNGNQALASAIFNQTPEQAVETARAQGLI